ncbi:MAG: formylglycine-generating enzyme family protein [Pseudomonadota bacterium]
MGRLFRTFGLFFVLLTLPFSLAAQEVAEDRFNLLSLPGGHFQMGDAHGDPNEAPHQAWVAPFRLMRFEVTNRQFADFVDESGHVTDPETRGFGFVWDRSWSRIDGADWRNPQGPGDGPAHGIEGKYDHPVVQISAKDAAAFCAWYGLRLPSEEEWEFAARGVDGRSFPWGNDPPAEGRQRRANFGTIPCCAPDDKDGFYTTAPVGRFPAGASPFGLEDMAGNVWEWTASSFPGRPDLVALRGGGWGNNPYCLRTSYRHGNPPNIGLDMVGFRCAADAAAK